MEVYILVILILILTFVLILSICALVIYTGIFIDIEIGAGKPPIEALQVFYKAGEGSFKDVGPACSDVTSIAPSYKSFAIYYDDPNKMQSRERWAVGAFIDHSGSDASEVRHTFQREGYKPFTFPKVQNVVKTSFPYTNPFSIGIGSYKVYPQLAYYVKEKRLCAHPWIEIYDGDTIHYMVPLSMQEEFYVPEVLPKQSQSDEPIRKGKRKQRGEGDGCDNDECEEQGVVNARCAPVVACEHSYATRSPEVKCQGTSDHSNVMTSAGEKLNHIVRNATSDTKRSKSVNLLTNKHTDTVRIRNTNSVPHTPRDQPSASLLEVSSGLVMTASQGQGEHAVGDSGEDSSINSSASSMSSNADTIESSFLSSEYSYSSIDTCVSRNASRLSADPDQSL